MITKSFNPPTSRLLSTGIAILSFLYCAGAALAMDTTCKGINLIDQLRKHQPELAKTIDVAANAVPNNKGLLWKVSKPGVKPSWLFGTMHLADPRLLDLPEGAETAFKQSNTLVLEITEILDPKKMAGQTFKLMKYTTYLDGSNLTAKLSAKHRQLVSARLARHAGLPWNVAERMKPWVAMGMIALPACELARKQANKPFLDMALGLRARKEGKNLVALETLEGQMAAMDGLPETMMIQALVDTARLGPQLDNIFETMIQLYIKGELGTIWAMMNHLGPNGLQAADQQSFYSEFQRVIVDQRNIAMANESSKLINTGGAFIAIGALHLPGKKGLLNILAQRGYTISAN